MVDSEDPVPLDFNHEEAGVEVFMTPEISLKEEFTDDQCIGTGDSIGVFTMCDMEVKETVFAPHTRIRLRTGSNILDFQNQWGASPKVTIPNVVIPKTT